MLLLKVRNESGIEAEELEEKLNKELDGEWNENWDN